MNRRKFISIAAISGIFNTNLLRSGEETISNGAGKTDVIEQSSHYETTRILPLMPESGSIAAITAPASPTSEWEIRSAVNAMKKLGLKVEIGQTVKNKVNKYKYFSKLY